MNTFKAYMLREAYKKVHQLGDKLAKAEALIDLEAFRPIVSPIYDNKGSRGGRPSRWRFALTFSIPTFSKIRSVALLSLRIIISSTRSLIEIFST